MRNAIKTLAVSITALAVFIVGGCSQPPVCTTWEYKVLTVLPVAQAMETSFGALGAEGWEYTGAFTRVQGSIYVTFKRCGRKVTARGAKE